MQYDEKTDKVVYDSDVTKDFTGKDWVRLALACLDQAGVSPIDLGDAYERSRLGKASSVLTELEKLVDLT